ncbi:MAG: diguanylate cyclase [Prochlorotrichaceae cyanobacterium]|jgi:diguanylate cyclase (GGDEF)-like protein
MANSSPVISAEITRLKQSYCKSLPDKLLKIAESWQRVLTFCEVMQAENGLSSQKKRWCSFPWNREEVINLHRLVHNLAGSGATFGLNALGDAAHLLDLFLQSVLQNTYPPTSEQCTQITALIQRLQSISIPSDRIINTPLSNEVPRHSLPHSVYHPNHHPQERRIFLLEEDDQESGTLLLQIASFGYRVVLFKTMEALQFAVAQSPPAAIIMDVMFVEDPPTEVQSIKIIQSLSPWPIPILFMSLRDDLIARLKAVRAEGDAYFTKPVNIWQLVDKLDRLVIHHLSDPYHILIVEDDPVLADYYQLILEEAGMKTIIVTNPTEVMEPLIEFKPDLILMDVYMPDCTGLELAAVIRQQETFVGIPITYLSRETDVETQMVAMSLGGDDFLTKPIQPDHLVAAVTSRVQRSRTLRSLMVRDSLTGLLNHTNIKEQLHIEVARSDRHNCPLSFAMLDIDNFKQVNDTYGHLAGDRVIKNLARLLRQRLRQTDILGRYGGEEFAVILTDTDGETAVKVLDAIRLDFGQVRQQLSDTGVSITFSCGIASFPDYLDATHLNDAADQALYKAKRRGRNRTVLAIPSDPKEESLLL